MLKLPRRKTHPRVVYATNLGLFGGHVAYYGAAAFHIDMLHAVAAGVVLFLLIVGFVAGGEVE